MYLDYSSVMYFYGFSLQVVLSGHFMSSKNTFYVGMWCHHICMMHMETLRIRIVNAYVFMQYVWCKQFHTCYVLRMHFETYITNMTQNKCLCSCGRYELGSAQDPPLQCDFWALYAGLVGALQFQYPLLHSLIHGFQLL